MTSTRIAAVPDDDYRHIKCPGCGVHTFPAWLDGHDQCRPDDAAAPGDFVLPAKACFSCGQRVSRNKRVRVAKGWLCVGCLEARAYIAGRQDAAEKWGA